MRISGSISSTLTFLFCLNSWKEFGDAAAAEPAKQMQPKDVLFLIDGSGSVKPRNFNKLRTLLKNLIDSMSVDYTSDQGDHVALIQFSSRKRTKVEFNLDQYNNKDDIKKAIDTMIYQRRYTYTGYGMEMANKEVFNGRGGDRPFAKNILLLFTDGHSADPNVVQAATAELKSRGGHIMSIGFGPERYIQRFQPELEMISSSRQKDLFLGGMKDEARIEKRLMELSMPKSDCSTRPCRNGAKCLNVGETFFCECALGFEGLNCEKRKGPCWSKPCLNGGTCVEIGEKFECQCAGNFYGKTCEKEKVVCTTKNTDILLIMDDSRSITNPDYARMKKFVIDLVYRFNISQFQSRVAIIQFSSKKNTRTEMFFDEYYDKEALMERIKALRQSDGGSTYTNLAFKMAREQVFSGKRGDRPDVRDVIVLLTDGQSHDNKDAIAEAKLLRDNDVSIISIGVGQGRVVDDFNNFLKALSSGDDYVFKASYANLDKILDGVTTAACANLQDM